MTKSRAGQKSGEGATLAIKCKKWKLKYTMIFKCHILQTQRVHFYCATVVSTYIFKEIVLLTALLEYLEVPCKHGLAKVWGRLPRPPISIAYATDTGYKDGTLLIYIRHEMAEP